MTTIAFLGAGNIAQAIMGGLIENGFAPGAMTACDPVAACQDRAREKGIIVADSNDAAVESADVILLCVKPNVMLEMLSSLSVPLTGKLLISVAAGITTNAMTRELPAGTAIVRCMPNTPALVQTGMTAMFATSDVTAGQQQQAENILSAVGQAIWVAEEHELDAVTAVSGSGPAYFFLMMESMIDAGIKEGLDRHTASQLVLQTALGAARMAIENPADPGTLRQQVTSPGGTTQAAIEYFQAAGFEKIVSGAVGAARARSIELSGEG
jgi:pyrroline-5-carboxylate reductase